MAPLRPSDADDASPAGEDLDPFRPPAAEERSADDDDHDAEPPLRKLGFFRLLRAVAATVFAHPGLFLATAAVLAAEWWFFTGGHEAIWPIVVEPTPRPSSDFVLRDAYERAIEGPPPEVIWARAERSLKVTILMLLFETWLSCGLTKAWLDACSRRKARLASIVHGGRWSLVSLGVNVLCAAAWGIPAVAAVALHSIANLSAAALLWIGYFSLATFIWTASSMATCATVAERRGVFGSLRRSFELAQPHLLPISGVLFVYGLLGWAIPFATKQVALSTESVAPIQFGMILVGAGRAFLYPTYVQAYLLAGGSPTSPEAEDEDSDVGMTSLASTAAGEQGAAP